MEEGRRNEKKKKRRWHWEGSREEGSECSSEARSKPVLARLPEPRVRTADGAELRADVLWPLVRWCRTQCRLLARASQDRKESRKQLIWLISCG